MEYALTERIKYIGDKEYFKDMIGTILDIEGDRLLVQFDRRNKQEPIIKWRIKREHVQRISKPLTLCYECGQTVCTCCWLNKLIPVKDWTAIPITLKVPLNEEATQFKDVVGYRVLRCPNYIPRPESKPLDDIKYYDKRIQ